MENYFGTISQAVESGDDKEVTKIVKEALTSGLPAIDILDKGLVPGNKETYYAPEYSLERIHLVSLTDLPPQELMFSSISGSTRLR